MRILLTGASGQVGGDLLPLLEPFASVVAPRRSELDLSDSRAIQRFVNDIKPDWIINPAAYTAVDKAESQPDLAYAINAEAPRAIGETAATLGIPVIHFSTDYVYSCAGLTPWVESDAPAPLNVYGASKLAGDDSLAASGAAHLIFRTSWIYSSRGRNFLLTILRLAREKEELRVVDDQYGAPTWSRNLARLVTHVIKTASERSLATGQPVENVVRAMQGVYHAADCGETTWFGFAQEFLRIAAEAQPDLKLARLTPIATSEYPTPAKRPSNSRLNCQRMRKVLGFEMPAWRESVAEVMAELLSPQRASMPTG